MRGAAAAEAVSRVKKTEDGRLLDAIREATKSPTQRKVSYAIPCASAFRDAVTLLAESRKVNVGDIARSVMLTMPESTVQAMEDPGEPDADDRETVILKSGPSAGKPWRRKPRLQVRMPAGLEVVTIRKALALALKLDRDALKVTLEDAAKPSARERLADQAEEIGRLRSVISALSSEILSNGIRTREEALYVLGIAPGTYPDMQTIKARFRMLATIHHPDSDIGNHERMAQLNDAIAFLRKNQ
ncbi:J domain-containing protein [Aestuariispira insulae]|nr:J domain-containing protein [Aestuariispira insulae]